MYERVKSNSFSALRIEAYEYEGTFADTLTIFLSFKVASLGNNISIFRRIKRIQLLFNRFNFISIFFNESGITALNFLQVPVHTIHVE